MKPLKICMVSTFYPPYNFGGDGIFVERLARALSGDGNEVHVVHDRDAFEFLGGTPRMDALARQNSQIKVHTIGAGRVDKFDMLARHQFGSPVKRESELRLLLDQDFDVIHFHNVSLLGGPGVLRLGRGVKLCTLHDHWFVCAMHVLWRYDREACTTRSCLSCTLKGKRPPQLWRYSDAVAKAARHVDAFIAPSHFAMSSHVRNGFPSPISVLPHFLPDELSESADAKLSPPHFRPYFFFVGRLEKLKGVQVLLEAFSKFRHADLLIAGTGVYEEALRERARDMPHVRFLGTIKPDELKNFYRHAIATLVPSLCFETFGLVALESFGQGTPAVVHDLGALPEVVREGGGVTYRSEAELIACLERLSTDDAWRSALSEQALSNLRANYTEQRHLAQYYAMIARLSGSRDMQEVR